MTAVIERQASAHNVHKPASLRLDTLPGLEFTLARKASVELPMHCGTPMTRSSELDAILAWPGCGSGQAEWKCACGFRQDAGSLADPLSAVYAASGKLESLQWEMDAAEAALVSALKAALAMDADRAALLQATGLTEDELDAVLQ